MSAEAVLREATRTWRRLGLSASAIAELSGELCQDLQSAQADGRDPDDYVGGDPRGLARTWAAARGLVRPRHRLLGVAVAGLCGMVPGAGLAVLAITLPSSLVFNDMVGNARFIQSEAASGGGVSTSYHYLPLLNPLVYLTAYVLALIIAALGAVTAVSAFLRIVGDPARLSTVRALCWSLPLLAVAGCAAGIASASTSGFSYGSRTVIQTLLAVVAAISVVLMLVRVAATRGPRRPRLG